MAKVLFYDHFFSRLLYFRGYGVHIDFNKSMKHGAVKYINKP